MTSDTHQPFVRFERLVEVSPETAFDTLTVPEQMRIWWGDDAKFDIDLQVGRRWTITRIEDGQEYLATGIYLEIARPSRLRYTFAMPQFSPNSDTITVDIEKSDQGCTITFEHAGVDIAKELKELPAGETSHSEIGWQQGFDMMVTAWAKPR